METKEHVGDAVAAATCAERFLNGLRRGEPRLVLGVRSARGAEIARFARASGHHGIWMDLEHSTMPVDAAAALGAAAMDLGLLSLVRVPERDYGVIGRLLDAGVGGIIVPRVETPEQAADAVAACRFPPRGHRSAVATLPCVGHARLPADALYRVADRSVLLQILVESPLGIENAEAIARVEGVDMLAIGTNDLSAELGVPGDFRHARVRAAHESALAACARAGKPLAIGGVADAAYAAELMHRGAAPFLMTGIDSDILLAAMTQRAEAARAAFDAFAASGAAHRP